MNFVGGLKKPFAGALEKKQRMMKHIHTYRISVPDQMVPV